MTAMPVNIGWEDVGLRLAVSVVAGILIGYNRTEYGKVAGLRTTLLVCLAASVAMIQVNLLLRLSGRPSDSFVMNDLMRLPLGILTGVGFIGAGAIIRRDNLVVGVTTAATLWYVTVIGLCFGGGQIELGMTATAIGLVALWGLQWLELRLRHEHRASMRVEIVGEDPNEDKIRAALGTAGLRVTGTRVALTATGPRRDIVFDLSAFRLPADTRSPPICEAIAKMDGVTRLEWSDRA
jgi:putative Mg2+ transporter-C (MgtC) family protein